MYAIMWLLVTVAMTYGQLSRDHKSLYMEAEYNYLIEYYDKALHWTTIPGRSLRTSGTP